MSAGRPTGIIEGVTIHCFLNVDIELNCNLQLGTTQTTALHKTHNLVVDEFSMLDATLFWDHGGPLQTVHKEGQLQTSLGRQTYDTIR